MKKYLLTIYGIQGHVAYPDQADNPIRYMIQILKELMDYTIDKKMCFVITSIRCASEANNVIPGEVSATIYNVSRISALEEHLQRICTTYASKFELKNLHL